MTMRVDPNLKVDALGNVKMLARSSRPYDLNIGFYTDTADVLVRTAVVQSVAIRYEDGEKIQLILPGQEKVMPFTSRRNSNWDGKSIVYHESFATGVNLTNCIAKNSSFTVECEGMLVRATGDNFPFSVRWDFRPRKLSGFLPAHDLDPEILNSELPRP